MSVPGRSGRTSTRPTSRAAPASARFERSGAAARARGGGAGEREIARVVAEWLEQADLEVEVLEPVAGRLSVVGVARGTGGGRSLMLNAHLDTVGTSGMAAPFSGRVEGGRLYGRGAMD